MKLAVIFYDKNNQKSNLHKFWNENMTEVEECLGSRVENLSMPK